MYIYFIDILGQEGGQSWDQTQDLMHSRQVFFPQPLYIFYIHKNFKTFVIQSYNLNNKQTTKLHINGNDY
jgi:hypothetical protein